MGFSLYNLFKAGLLVTNGLAIVHPKRVLSIYGLDSTTGPDPLKNQVAGFLQAVSYLKVPLVIINCLLMLIELVFGG